METDEVIERIDQDEFVRVIVRAMATEIKGNHRSHTLLAFVQQLKMALAAHCIASREELAEVDWRQVLEYFGNGHKPFSQDGPLGSHLNPSI